MKNKSTLLALAAMLGTVAISAAEEGQKPERQRRQPSPEIIKKFDKDGDGKLSDDERKAMREEREARQKADLERFDADKDGKLSDDERKTLRETKHKELLEKYDKDKDGKLSDDERKAAIEAGEELGGRRGPRPDGPKKDDGGE